MYSGGATPGRARSNDLAGRSTDHRPGSALLIALLCFGNSVHTTYKFTISDRWPLYLFYFDSETISAALAAFVFWGRLKRSSTFLRKESASGWPGSRMFWPRNDLSPLLCWRRYCTCTAKLADNRAYNSSHFVSPIIIGRSGGVLVGAIIQLCTCNSLLPAKYLII